MSEPKPSSPKGNRKVKVTRENSLIILLGFIIACWMSPPTELFVAFIIGVSGTAFSFMWGNTKEHEHSPIKQQHETTESIK